MIPWLLAAFAFLQPPDGLHSLRAVVSDAKGNPVRDLASADVSLSVGGATASLTRFEKDERPARFALLIDSSQPMASAYRLEFMDAAKAFIASLPANTHVSVWTTGDRPVKVVDDLNLQDDGSAREVAARLGRVAPMGGNTILDAIVEAAQDLSKQEGERKVIVFLSAEGPGFLNDSRQSIVDRVLKTGVEVAGTLVSETGDPTSGGEASTEDYNYVFANLTEKTAGRLERPVSVMGAAAAMRRVAADLGSTYRLSFYQGAGRPTRLALQVARPQVRIRLSVPQKETASP